jgi:predicted phage terminase large subunit-like protein
MGIHEDALEKVEQRALAKSNKLYLATEVLGYDFTEETHQELFDLYPNFTDTDTTPWVKQFTKRDLLVLWPRGHFKTTAVIVVVIQAILNNPDIRVLLMQGTLPVTRNLLKEIASHFNGTASNSKLAELFPEFCGDKKKIGQTRDQFTTPARKKKQLPQATCTVASPKSVKTGQHYDLGVFDDLVNDQNYKKPVLLQKTEEDFNMCLPLIDPGCPRFVSGTRYAFGDLYENIILKNLAAAANSTWVVSLKTCWSDANDGTPRFPQHTTKDGRVVGFTPETLLQIMKDTPSIYASQYLNQPAMESQQVITEAQLNGACVLEPNTPALSQAILVVDLAGGGGDRPDDSVIIAGKMDSSGIGYVVDALGGVWQTNELALCLIHMALKHRPLKILIENTASAQYFAAYLQMVCKDKGLSLPVDFLRVDNQPNAKNVRVEAMAGRVKEGRFKFLTGLNGWDKIVQQTIQFPKGKYGHDDWPDTIALLCQELGKTYLRIADPSVVRTKHPFIALMERNSVTITSPVLQDIASTEPTMGDGFCC